MYNDTRFYLQPLRYNMTSQRPEGNVYIIRALAGRFNEELPVTSMRSESGSDVGHVFDDVTDNHTHTVDVFVFADFSTFLKLVLTSNHKQIS